MSHCYLSEMMQWIQEDDILPIANAVLENSPFCAPYYVEIHITNRCNSNCYFCNQKLFGKNRSELTIDNFQYLVNHLSNMGVKAIRLSGGGEPTIHPQILEVIDTIYNKGITLSSFDTNGIELSSDISNRLLEGELQNLHISLQAPTPESWEKITKRSVSDFELVLTNIKEFIQLDKNRRVNVYVSFVIDPITYDELDQVYFLREYLGVRVLIHDLNCYPYDDEFLMKLLPPIESLLSEDEGNVSIFIHSMVTNFGKQNNQIIRSTMCYAPWVSALIKPDGNVYPCCGLQIPHNVLGNILQEDFANVWSGEKYTRLRNEAKNLFSQLYKVDDRQCVGQTPHYLPDSCIYECAVKLGMFSCPPIDMILKCQNKMVDVYV